MSATAQEDLRMILPGSLAALATSETTADPDQGGGLATSGQVTDPETTLIMDPGRLEPTMWAADHPPEIGHLHHETFD
jgi:hypothetical protein